MGADENRFAAVVVHPADGGAAAPRVEWLDAAKLPPGDVTIAVEWSSLNYKDAIAAEGHRGVVGRLPHVPGIDCAGRVVQSDDSRWAVGQPAVVTGYDLGSGAWGGWASRVRVPADWIVPLPEGLSLRDTMVYGTAGFTAAQSVAALQRGGVEPDAGEVLVTGATGGVGMFALAILAKLGYSVVAMTGKPDKAPLLEQLGAKRIVGRDLFADAGDGPLLSAEWAGAVDTVGGATLAGLIRSTRHRGCVTACGLVAGDQLPLTVYPFLLRGVTLAGIDSAKCPRAPRLLVWERLAGPWKVDLPADLISEVTLDKVADRAQAMRAGQTFGRTLVVPRTEAPLSG